jgi:hypothetical protein
MENASKALIIAGAILLSILIIALGIYVFSMAKGTINTTSLDELEISNFNTEFTMYEGKQLGSNVKTLLNKVLSNASENAESAERLPDVTYVDSSNKGPSLNITAGSGITVSGKNVNITSDVSNPNRNAISALRNKISNSHKYTVTIDTDNDSGLVNLITIAY